MHSTVSRSHHLNGTRLLLVCTGVLLAGTVIAHGGATGIVKERMDMMKHAGDNMKQVSDMIKGKTAFDTTLIARNAGTIMDTAAKIPDMFPTHSLHEPSEALPAIWQEWDKFSALSVRLGDEAKKLQVTAQGGDRQAITRQFARLGKACSACHTDFRKKKKHKHK